MAYINRGLNHSHHTTIHQQVLACYVGGIIRKEERRRLSELLQPPDPLHRNRIDDVLVHRIGINKPWQNRIHPNPMWRSRFGMNPRPSRQSRPEDAGHRPSQVRLLGCVAGNIKKRAVLLANHHRHNQPLQHFNQQNESRTNI
jgi:hypothetical protein